MPYHLDNPAGRLQKFFDDLWGLPRQVDGWTGVAQVLGVGDDPIGEQVTMLRRFAAIVEIPGEVETLIRSIDGQDHDLLLRWTPAVRNTLGRAGPNSGQVEQFVQEIRPDVLLGIEMCSALLHRNFPETEVSEQQVESLRSLIDEFISELTVDAAVPQSLRVDLLRQAQRIRDALEDAQVAGTTALRDAVEGVVGWADIHANPQDEARQPILRKLGKVVAAAMGILALAGSDYTLAYNIFPELPHANGVTVIHVTTVVEEEVPVLEPIPIADESGSESHAEGVTTP